MITVKRGDVVQVRGERDLILVTDAADQDPDAYRTYSFILGRDETGQVFEQEFVSSEMPVETIFMGNPCSRVGAEDYYPLSDRVVVTDMSEVISVLN
jgi:hypothetical protein